MAAVAERNAGRRLFRPRLRPDQGQYDPSYRQFDVEGYRVYRGRTDSPNTLQLLAQFDKAGTQIYRLPRLHQPDPRLRAGAGDHGRMRRGLRTSPPGGRFPDSVGVELNGEIVQIKARRAAGAGRRNRDSHGLGYSCDRGRQRVPRACPTAACRSTSPTTAPRAGTVGAAQQRPLLLLGHRVRHQLVRLGTIEPRVAADHPAGYCRRRGHERGNSAELTTGIVRPRQRS